MASKKQKDPAFLFYPADFLIECADLDWSERGQYITMLCLQHEHGHLSRKILSLNIPEISNEVLLKFSIDKEEKFYSKKLEILIKKREEHSKKQRENALKRWNKNSMPPDMPSHMPNDNQEDAKNMPLRNEDEDENINRNIVFINNLLNNIIDINIGEFVSKNLIKNLSEIELKKIKLLEQDFSKEKLFLAVIAGIFNHAKTVNYLEKVLDSWEGLDIEAIVKRIFPITKSNLPSWINKKFETIPGKPEDIAEIQEMINKVIKKEKLEC